MKTAGGEGVEGKIAEILNILLEKKTRGREGNFRTSFGGGRKKAVWREN